MSGTEFTQRVPASEFRELLAELETFRAQRLGDLRSGALYGQLGGEHRFVCHLLPLGGLNDVRPLAWIEETVAASVPPPGSPVGMLRFNADGFFTASAEPDGRVVAYVQWLRCGGLEAVGTRLTVEPRPGNIWNATALRSAVLRRWLFLTLPVAIEATRSTGGVAAPLALSAALCGMKDVRLVSHDGEYLGEPIGRDLVLAPWLVIEPGAQPTPVVEALADIIWQSSGFASAPEAARG